MKKAAELMDTLGADFVATGEVVGKRPMSQLKHRLNHIEKVSGLKGRLLRPLSAKILEPTIPEIEGKVDRSMLLDISGRGRKRQIELAEHYGIENYSHPAAAASLQTGFFDTA
jgi:tRNA U34 2-thiouridine synthase MnmA/TrmU